MLLHWGVYLWLFGLEVRCVLCSQENVRIHAQAVMSPLGLAQTSTRNLHLCNCILDVLHISLLGSKDEWPSASYTVRVKV